MASSSPSTLRFPGNCSFSDDDDGVGAGDGGCRCGFRCDFRESFSSDCCCFWQMKTSSGFLDLLDDGAAASGSG